MEDYSAIKGNEVQVDATTLTNIENIMLSERSIDVFLGNVQYRQICDIKQISGWLSGLGGGDWGK